MWYSARFHSSGVWSGWNRMWLPHEREGERGDHPGAWCGGRDCISAGDHAGVYGICDGHSYLIYQAFWARTFEH